MNPRRTPSRLERGAYRRRRIMDGARMLPVAGFVLILLPVLWSDDSGDNVAAEAVYLFGLWCVLIAAAAILSRPLRAGLGREGPGGYPLDAPPFRTTGQDGAAKGGDAETAPDRPEPPR
ncbi:MAG: Branched-chain amino acid transport protein (AzlD) [Rhodobacteraceae bacterium HLUCCA12]|nr:MAG: Branched-chain amino acid transport protein (AzlD) [Rhodobacteraceae bacterium HLUCCA12]